MKRSVPAPFVQNFATLYGNRLSLAEKDLLHRLATDDRMAEFWAKVSQHFGGEFRPASLIAVILENKNNADSVHLALKQRTDIANRFAFLVSAASALQEYFERVPISSLDSLDASQSTKAFRTRVRDARETLKWAADYIAEVHRLGDESMFAAFPSSQKRDEPAVAFSVMMCSYLNESLTLRLYDLVATLTEVVFEQDGEPSPDSVRMAWRRHLKRSAQSSSNESRNPSTNDFR